MGRSLCVKISLHSSPFTFLVYLASSFCILNLLHHFSITSHPTHSSIVATNKLTCFVLLVIKLSQLTTSSTCKCLCNRMTPFSELPVRYMQSLNCRRVNQAVIFWHIVRLARFIIRCFTPNLFPHMVVWPLSKEQEQLQPKVVCSCHIG